MKRSKNKVGFAVYALGATALFLTQAVFAAEMDHTSHAGHDMPGHSGHTSHDMSTGAHVSHQHGAGQWMLEYRFMSMKMDGMLDGTDSISAAAVTGTMMNPGPYMMAPTEMTMDMHMLMGMYGINRQLTVMAMLHSLSKDMDMVNRMGVTSSMETSGIGDTRLSALFNIDQNWVGTLGVSIPTGSIDEKVLMMGNPNAQAPYPMQLGSGTYDLIPAVTYDGKAGPVNLGVQAEYTFRIGENDNGYALGDRMEIATWVKQKLGRNVVVSGRLDYKDWGTIEGQDSKIMNIMMAPTVDPANQGGTRMDLQLGVNGVFSGHTVGLEFGVPLYQRLDGPQMETKSILSLSYQYAM